jgi:uncharacterized protein
MPFLARIDTTPILALTDPIAPDKIVSGSPVTGVRAGLESSERGFYTGVWASSVGAWRIKYEEDELCTILEGRVRLTGKDGEAQEYKAGDTFTIASGFEGVWETIEPVRKIYAIAT